MFVFDHVALSVRDLDTSTRWYVKHFGFTLEAQYDKPSLNARFAYLKLNNARLELFEVKKPKALPAYRRTLAGDVAVIGCKNFALRTSNLSRAVKTLARHGVHPAIPPTFGSSGRWYAFYTDPDGILVELYERTPTKRKTRR